MPKSVASYLDQLTPASFRGVAFETSGSRVAFGRRSATHEYPQRDTVWIEDLGRAARRITLTGFLIGDDVIAAREELMRAAELPGEGVLIHPTLGSVNAALIDVESSESWDRGRVFELVMTFVEQGQQLYPDAGGPLSAGTSEAVDAAQAAVKGAFDSTIAAALTSPASLDAVSDAVSGFSGQAAQATQGATALIRMTAVLPASMNGLVRSGTGILSGQVVDAAADMTVKDLIGLGASGRQALSGTLRATADAAAALSSATVGALSAAIALSVDTVRTVLLTPGDSIQALAQLARFSPAGGYSGSALTANTAVVTLMRRTALVGACKAAIDYAPQTTDDAIAVRDLLLGLLNAEIDIAGDTGDDAAYISLRNLRASITQLLAIEGATLPKLVDISTPLSTPALALAQRLYRDPSRAVDLARRSGAIHPAFLPTSFKGLSE